MLASAYKGSSRKNKAHHHSQGLRVTWFPQSSCLGALICPGENS